MAQAIKAVLIVGSGPCGLLLALMLAQHGIEVQVLEALDDLDKRPRGVGYGPAAVAVLQRANVLDKIRAHGLTPDSMTWRKLDGTPIKTLPGLSSAGDKSGVILPVEDLTRLLYEEVSRERLAKVHFNHRVVSVGQSDDSAWVSLEDGRKFEGTFIVGCDGASSAVRKSLFGSNFPGKTWDKVIIGTNVVYDFTKYGWTDMSWVIDPKHFAVLCQITKDGVWRVSYGDETHFSHDELRERLHEKLSKLLPGNPATDQYQVLRFSPYAIHQRCAEHMRVGRVLLAGDAAHLCNPMGGLGLTTGISDIGSLVDCFYGIHDGKATLDILDKYDEARRNIFSLVTDANSTANLKRVRSDVESVINGQDPFFALLDAAEKDPSIYGKLFEAEFKLSADLTQYYDNPKLSSTR